MERPVFGALTGRCTVGEFPGLSALVFPCLKVLSVLQQPKLSITAYL